MANTTITGLAHISSTEVAAADVFLIDHVSALITRKITLANVTTYLSSAIGVAHTVQGNLDSFASYANANASALSSAIANISANISANFSIAGDTGTDVVVVGPETLTFSGGTGLNTIVTNNTVTTSLANTTVVSGSYGGTDGAAIIVPTISIDNQGRITAAQNTSVTVDLSAVQTNINTVQSNISTVAAAVAAQSTIIQTVQDNVTINQSGINIVQSNVYAISDTIGNVDSLATTEKSSIVAAINSINTTLNTFDTIITGDFVFSGRTLTGINSVGATIYSQELSSGHFAKLLINVEDLTYGQYQSSEVLLVHDNNSAKIVEYGITHTSTNPIATYDATIVGSNVEIYAQAVSASNTIKVLKITS